MPKIAPDRHIIMKNIKILSNSNVAEYFYNERGVRKFMFNKKALPSVNFLYSNYISLILEFL